MSVRFAFAGFRHGHIFGLLNYVNEHTDTTLVGACEEDADYPRRSGQRRQGRNHARKPR